MKASVLLIVLCAALAAQSRPQEANTAPKSHRTQATANGSTSAATPMSFARYETFTNVTIPAGQTVNLDSALDYSSSDTVNVTLRSTNPDLLHLIGTAYFTVPNTTELVTQEVMVGTNFNYSNSGGATFQVCGTQFRLALFNGGTSTMTLSTVILYTHVI